MKVPPLLVIAVFVLSFSLQTQAQSIRYARVVAQEANLRDSPSISGELELAIAEDTLVKVLDEKLPWYVVRVGNRVGWMHGDTLEFINGDTRSPGQAKEQTVAPDYSPVKPKPSDYPPEILKRSNGLAGTLY